MFIFGFFVKNPVSIGVWTYMWIFNLILLINTSIFMTMMCCFYYINLVTQLKFGVVILAEVLLLFGMVLVMLILFYFHVNLQNLLWFSVENCVEILMGVIFNLYIEFSTMATFTILILPIHENGRITFFDIYFILFLQIFKVFIT